jgi:phosphoribosyl 1,2-cyclic phosphate phosphodiesterase
VNEKFDEVLFLGTGTSTGVPIPGCPCQICHSNDPRNKRFRSSIFIKSHNNLNFVIDTGPDLRSQLLQSNITKLDFAIITHCHADHVGGIDDLRPFTFLPKRKTVPVFCHPYHYDEIKNKFAYIFKRKEIFNKSNPYVGGGLPALDLYPITELDKMFPLEDLSWELAPHGNTKTMILFYKTLCYLIDCHQVPTEIKSKITNNSTLIIDCVKKGRHPSHLGTEQCEEILHQVQPKKAYLTHLGHDLEHTQLEDEFKKKVGKHVEVAYDGLMFSLKTG